MCIIGKLYVEAADTEGYGRADTHSCIVNKMNKVA